MSLAHPYWLLALILLPLIVIGAGIMSHRQSGKWGKLVAGRLRDSLIRRDSPIPRWLAFTLLLAATTFIITAMSRPQGDGGVRAEKSMGRNLLLTLDLSRSMRVDDVKPDRLSLAKLAIYELLEAMPNDRIGLIGFAGEPHLYAPLTIDHAAVRETVEQMDETWPTLGGSDLGSAVRLGIETLKKTGQRNNAMVIISDGEKHEGDTEQMIMEAREAGVYIITIGVGTEDGGYVPNDKSPDNRLLDKGKPVLSRLHPDTLIKLARETNGSFAVAGSGADIPNMVTSAIAGLDAFEVEGKERQVFIEFYQWLVLPAILLLIASLIAGTRWRGLQPTAALGAIALLLTTPGLQAQEATPSPEHKQMEHYHQLAEKALLNGSRARYRLGEASAAYRLKEWDRASNAYSQALQSNNDEVRSAAHHGLGNTLFQTGWLRFLDKPYTAELESVPSMKRFEAAVRIKLEMLKRAEDDAQDDETTADYSEIKQTILDWSDSVRHYQSVLDLQSDHQGAIQNRELTIAYLRKLQEMLIEDEKQTEEQMPEPSPEPDDSGKDGDCENPGGNNPGGDQPQEGPQGSDPRENQQGDPNGQRDPNQQPNPNQDPKQRQRDPNAPGDEEDENARQRPDETPEEHARRRLKEGADYEKGPMTPGRILYRKPKKDW